MLLFGILIGGYCFRIFERPTNFQDFADYGNSMWLTILTMTTVGYGEIKPVTILGRLIGFLLSI